jgi:ATP-binding cassette, subfamily B, bacterial RamB/AmfA
MTGGGSDGAAFGAPNRGRNRRVTRPGPGGSRPGALTPGRNRRKTRPGPDGGSRGAIARSVVAASLRSHPRDVAWLAAWSLAESLPSFASGWVVAEAVGRFLAGRTVAGIGWLGLLALTALVGAGAARQAYTRLGALVEPLRDDLVRLIVTGALRRSMAAAQRPDTDAVARITHQTEIVRDAYAGLLSVARTFLFTAVSTLAGLLTLVPAALPYVIPPVLGALLILRLLLRPFAARQRNSVLGEERVANSAASAVRGLRDVTACGAEATVLAQIAGDVAAQADAARSAARVGALRTLSMAAGGWLPLLLVLAAAPSLLRGGVTAAQIIGAVTYIGGAMRSALYTLGQGVGGSAVRLTVTLQRILDASAGAPESPPGSRGPAAVHGGVAQRDMAETGPAPAGWLELRDVGFGYGASAEPIIADLSIDIPPGDHLAIVGPSGIGKSSLAGLLAGMLRPTTGQIFLDGARMERLSPAAMPLWRVLLPQEAYVFSGTLAENLGYLLAEWEDADFGPAVDAVGLRPLLARLGGYQAMLNPAALSAGERQLIALARAYISPAPIAILDEATAHLDPAAETRAEQAFARRPGTLIVVAHRMSSALRARRALVLGDDRAHIGDHASLLACSAMYRDLVGYWNAPAGPGPYPAGAGTAGQPVIGRRS